MFLVIKSLGFRMKRSALAVTMHTIITFISVKESLIFVTNYCYAWKLLGRKLLEHEYAAERVLYSSIRCRCSRSNPHDHILAHV